MSSCFSNDDRTISCYFSLTIECKAKIDLAFIVDGSGSIENAGIGNYDKVKNFVKALTRAFEVSKEETHVGIISYDHEAKVESLSHFRVYNKWFSPCFNKLTMDPVLR